MTTPRPSGLQPAADRLPETPVSSSSNRDRVLTRVRVSDATTMTTNDRKPATKMLDAKTVNLAAWNRL